MTDTSRYPAQVFWSDEDEGFIALATDLPGCSAFGETQQEAVAELQDAIAAWIEAARAAGNPVPEPSRPGSVQYSGKVLVRMPRDLHAQLAKTAKNEDVSLNQYIVYLLASANTHHAHQASMGIIAHLVTTEWFRGSFLSHQAQTRLSSPGGVGWRTAVARELTLTADNRGFHG